MDPGRWWIRTRGSHVARPPFLQVHARERLSTITTVTPNHLQPSFVAVRFDRMKVVVAQVLIEISFLFFSWQCCLKNPPSSKFMGFYSGQMIRVRLDASVFEIFSTCKKKVLVSATVVLFVRSVWVCVCLSFFYQGFIPAAFLLSRRERKKKEKEQPWIR